MYESWISKYPILLNLNRYFIEMNTSISFEINRRKRTIKGSLNGRIEVSLVSLEEGRRDHKLHLIPLRANQFRSEFQTMCVLSAIIGDEFGKRKKVGRSKRRK